MAANSAEKLGKGPCPHCGEPVTFKRSAGKKITFTCDADGCDSSGFAEPGSGRAEKWLASIVKPRNGPAPAPEPAPPAPPAPDAKKSAFSLDQL